MTNSVSCQVCLTPFSRISDLKQHVRSNEHRQKMCEIFKKDKFRHPDMFPNISVANLVKQDTHPIVGLSLLTLCFSPEINIFFYLCHVCEEKCPPDRIACHLHSGGHCSNYFNYTDPNVLIFSWVPSMDMRVILRPEMKRKINKSGSGQLQVLDLPENLLIKLETSIYSEVMRTLSENDKLLKLIKDVKPKRTMLQTYQRDEHRKHPLLGMQHVVECICVGPTEKRYYLCTLCKLTFAIHVIIKHVLSFDHIHSYFKEWHPSTLMSKECYKDHTNSLASIILDFAKQTEQIHGTANAEMKQVSLEPDQFKSVNFNCYAEALKSLESITQENKESPLTTIVKPGNKLERCVPSAVSGALQYKIRCQNCSMTFDTACQYSKHLTMFKHTQMLEKFFGHDESARDGYNRKVWPPRLGLYTYLKNSLKQNQQCIGASLVVMCFTSEDQVKPFYLCFACEERFPESLLRQHFLSRKHLIHTLLYHNPWRLPFAWKNCLDVQILRSVALDEEKERGPNQMMLKVLDIPSRMLGHFFQNYPNVMASLNDTEYQTLLMQGVPQCETYSKLVQNEKFPLLGEQFLVMHDVYFPQHQFTDTALLCLLCARRLSKEESPAHVFSHEHVLSFLEHFHPGSVKSSTGEEILDLAKQAVQIHPISHKQVVNLDRPIWEPCTYQKALSILGSAKKRAGEGRLKPLIMQKKRLVPRKILEDMDKGHVKDTHQETSQMVEGSEKQTSRKPVDNIETTLKNISAEVGTDATNTCIVESVGETPTPSEKESEQRTEVSSTTSTDAIRNVRRESLQIKEEQIEKKIKEEMTEEPFVRKPIGDTLESCQNSDKANGMEVGDEKGKSSSDIKQLKNGTCHYNKRKRLSSTSDKSMEEICPNMDGEQEMDHKRPCLISKQDSSCEEPQNLPNIEKKEVTPAEVGEGSKPTHETTKEEGFGALFKCQCDQSDTRFFCGCCALKSPERDIIISQKMNTVVSDLQEEIYNNVTKQNSDVEELKTQNVCCELASSSAGSDGQHVDASVNLPTHHTVHCFPDNMQVVEMEIDDPEDTEASSVTAASSEVTETTSKTNESNEDVKLTRTDLCESADKANTHLTISKSIKMASSVTNATCLHLDSTGDGLKAEIISNTTLGQLKIATTSITEATFQVIATSHSPVITATKSTTTISKCPARSPNSATDDTKLTTPNSSIRTSTSSCAATTPTTSRLRESERPTCDANATTTKLTAATCDSSTTSKIEKNPNSETASKTLASSQTLASSVKCENTQASAETVKQSVGPNAHFRFRSSPAAPDSTILMLVGSENKNQPKKSSHTSASMTKPLEVGLNYLIKVTCKRKRQIYCQLCSVRLEESAHVTTVSHKYNYVKKLFGCNVPPPQLESKLDKIVAHLHEAEKDVGSQDIQTMEVNIDLYNELRALPVDKAIKRLKEKLRQRISRVSSRTSTSSCEALSPDDEMESPSKEKRNLAVRLTERPHSMRSSDPQTDLSSDMLNSHATLEKSEREPIATSSVGDTDTAAGKTERNQDVVDPLPTDSEAAGTIAQTAETAERRQQQERSDQDLQDLEMMLEDTQKTSLEKVFHQKLASGNTEQQNQSRPSNIVERARNHSGCSPGPPNCSTSHSLSSILIGERIQGPSNLSASLRVMGNKPIIGLSSIWECRGVSSNKLPSFFLCESCMDTVFNQHICDHMFSAEHQLNYMLKRYPQHTWFWNEKDLTHDMKMHILMGVVKLLSQQEFVAKMDAQVVLLREDLYNCVKTAPFSEALKVVQSIKKEPHLYMFSMMQQCDQQPKDPRPEDQSQECSLSTEQQSPQSLDAHHRSDNEARQKSENHDLKETVMDGNLDGDKQRKVLNPLGLTSVSSTNVDSVASSLPGADTCHSPQETCGSLSVKHGPPVSQQQRPELRVKRAGVHLESPTSSVSPKTSQTSSVSPRNECLPIRKRPAVASLETQVKPDTDNPQLDHPLPAKRTCSHSEQSVSQPSTESASKFTSVNPDAASTHMPAKDEEAAPGAEDISIVDWGKYAKLVALIKKMKSELNVSTGTLQPDNARSTTSCTDNSPQHGVESRWDSGNVQTRSKLENKTGRWDSKFQRIKAMVKQNRLSAASSEMFSTAPTVVSCENHVATLETNWLEDNANSITFHSAITAAPIDPQHQINVNTQSMFGNLDQFQPDHCEATHHMPGQIPQPQVLAETDSTGDRQFPIIAIGTTRPDPANKESIGGSNGWNYAEVNGGSQLANSSSTVAEENYRHNLTSSGQYVLYNQRAYGQISSYLPDEAVTQYTSPGYTVCSYQLGAYNPRCFYPSQIYPEQKATGFGHLATPTLPGCLSLEMQQQQQLMQQHYYSFTGAALAAGNGSVTNEAACQGALPFTAQASSSQMFINLNEYSTHNPQVYPNPAAADFPITNNEVTSQARLNPMFASNRGFF